MRVTLHKWDCIAWYWMVLNCIDIIWPNILVLSQLKHGLVDGNVLALQRLQIWEKKTFFWGSSCKPIRKYWELNVILPWNAVVILHSSVLCLSRCQIQSWSKGWWRLGKWRGSRGRSSSFPSWRCIRWGQAHRGWWGQSRGVRHAKILPNPPLRYGININIYKNHLI